MSEFESNFAKIAQSRDEVNEGMLGGGIVGGASGSAGSLINQGRKIYKSTPRDDQKALLEILEGVRNNNVDMNYRQAAKMGLLGLAGGTLAGGVVSAMKSESIEGK